ncbi:arginine vasopressin receptor 2, like [Scleropages formosus]|uniref:Arginine vasopressin receptor 2, like n=1 Tax=Scleropages formosus TaxID=113540 RepID=A0A8C9R6D1_SCLFO|nr:vasopressin V2 receptor-like [Scleropages formosus]
MNCSNRSAERELAERASLCRDSAILFTFVKVAVLGSVFSLATAGNALLLYVLWRKRRRKTRSQLFLLHLCLADLLVALFQVLPQLSVEITRRARGSELACSRALKYVQLVGMFASTYTIVAMAVDHYYHAACRHAVSFFTTGSCRRYTAIGAAWAMSFAFSAPQLLLVLSVQDAAGQRAHHCWATFAEPWGNKIYVTWLTLSVFVLPLLVLLFCQVKMCRGIYSNMKRKALPSDASQARTCSRAVSSAALKTLKMTCVVTVLYTLCWSPFFVLQLWSAWSPGGAPADGATFGIIMLLASVNSCMKPWVYLYYS